MVGATSSEGVLVTLDTIKNLFPTAPNVINYPSGISVPNVSVLVQKYAQLISPQM